MVSLDRRTKSSGMRGAGRDLARRPSTAGPALDQDGQGLVFSGSTASPAPASLKLRGDLVSDLGDRAEMVVDPRSGRGLIDDVEEILPDLLDARPACSSGETRIK
jgi:hypothetical protein